MITEAQFSKLHEITNQLFIAKDLANNETVVVKKVKASNSEADDDIGASPALIRQISALKNLLHPNIVQLKASVHLGSHVLLVYEHLDTNLTTFLNNIPQEQLLEPCLIRQILQQLLSAVYHCHSQGMIHCNINPRNVLVSHDHNTFKLCGFGHVQQANVPFHNGQSTVVAVNDVFEYVYQSPEILMHSSYSFSTDIWSVGCIFAELLKRKALFTGNTSASVLDSIFRVLGTPTAEENIAWNSAGKSENVRELLPSLLHQLGVVASNNLELDLLQKMFRYDPKLRISAKAALQHPYLKAHD